MASAPPELVSSRETSPADPAAGGEQGEAASSDARSDASRGSRPAAPLRTQSGSWRGGAAAPPAAAAPQPAPAAAAGRRAGRGSRPRRPPPGSPAKERPADKRVPWSPLGSPPTDVWGRGFGPPAPADPPSSARDRPPHTPFITRRAQLLKDESRSGEDIGCDLYSKALQLRERRERELQEIVDAAVQQPWITDKARVIKRPGGAEGTCKLLYEQATERAAGEQERRQQHDKGLDVTHSFAPTISEKARRLNPRGDRTRYDWAATRAGRLEELRQKKQEKEDEEQAGFGSVTVDPVSERMARKRHEEGRRIEDRLLALAKKSRERIDGRRKLQEANWRRQSSPHLNRASAARPSEEGPCHERLYRDAAARRPRDESPSLRGSECCSDSCTFSPRISRRSHVLAGGDIPKHEPVEDRLLRQGAERRERQQELMGRLERLQLVRHSTSRRRAQSAEGSARRSSFRDPIGVDNPRVQEELSQKHGADLTFHPYIGENTRVIDRQVRGTGGWEERVLSLYHAHYSKELRLERIREDQDRQELMMCQPKRKAHQRGTAPASPAGTEGADLHDRGRAWKMQVQSRLGWWRHHADADTTRECTFEPAINRRSRSATQRSSGYGRGSAPQSAPQSPRGGRGYARLAAPSSAPQSPRGPPLHDAQLRVRAVSPRRQYPASCSSPPIPVSWGQLPRAALPPPPPPPPHVGITRPASPPLGPAPRGAASPRGREPRRSALRPRSRSRSAGSAGRRATPPGRHPASHSSPCGRGQHCGARTVSLSPPPTASPQGRPPFAASPRPPVSPPLPVGRPAAERERQALQRQIDFHRAAIQAERQQVMRHF